MHGRHLGGWNRTIRDNLVLSQVVFYTLTLSTGNAVGMFILFGARLPGSLALLLSSVSAFFFTTTILYLSVEVRLLLKLLFIKTTKLATFFQHILNLQEKKERIVTSTKKPPLLCTDEKKFKFSFPGWVSICTPTYANHRSV